MAATLTWTSRARASNTKEKMAKAKMPRQRAKVCLQTGASSVAARAIGAKTVQ